MNDEGGFEDKISLTNVVEAAAGSTPVYIAELFEKLRSANERRTVNDPTAWLCKALAKQEQRGSSTAEGGKKKELDTSVEDAVHKGIAWLNNEGGFDDKISLDAVLEAAEQSSEEKVTEIFDKIVSANEKSEIKDPTAWICKGLRSKRRR